jgi:hypothetical protein
MNHTGPCKIPRHSDDTRVHVSPSAPPPPLPSYASSKKGIEGEDHEEILGTNVIEHHDLESPGPAAKPEMKSQITLPRLPVWSQRSHTTTGNLQVLAVLIRGKIYCPRRAHRMAPMSIVRIQANPLYVTL